MKPITKRMRKDFETMFAELQPMAKTERNKCWLTPEQVNLIKTTRAAGITPKQIEELTGISVYKIHKIVNSKSSMQVPMQAPLQPQSQSAQHAAVQQLQDAVDAQPAALTSDTLGCVEARAPQANLPALTAEPTSQPSHLVLNRPHTDPLFIVISAARGEALLFDQIQKKKQKQLRKQIPAGHPIDYYCEKYAKMNEKARADYFMSGRPMPDDFALRKLMLAKLISDMEFPTKQKRNKDKYNKNKKTKATAPERALDRTAISQPPCQTWTQPATIMQPSTTMQQPCSHRATTMQSVD